MTIPPPDVGSVSVVLVEERSHVRDFLGVPHRVHADDPAWIPPLVLEQRHRVFHNAPFLRHARTRAWVAYRDGRPAGRITAQLDRLQPPQDGLPVGYFGMLDASEDASVFSALTRAAENWLRDQGAGWIRGPYNLSINEEVGLLVENFEAPPFFMMGHARPYYADQLRQQGYEGVRDLLTYHITSEGYQPSRTLQRLSAGTGREVTVRPLNRGAKSMDFEVMRDIFNDGWSANWGFVPFTRDEFAELGRMLSLFLDHRFVQIAEVNERPVAFIVALPNLNEVLADLNGQLLPFGWLRLLWRARVSGLASGRVALMGIRREYQHTRLGPALAFMVIDAAARAMIDRGMRQFELGWILEDNSGMRHMIEDVGGSLYKRYRIYQKQL